MILLEQINWKKVRKAVLYLICILLTVWLQTMVLARVRIFGAAPFILPALAVAIGMWEGGVWGASLGMVAGAYCDMCFSDTTVLFFLLFTVFGFAAGALTEFLINRRFAAYLLLAAAVLVITALCQALPLWFFRDTALWPPLKTALLQALWSLPLAAPLYPIIKSVAGKQRRS